MGKVFDQIDAGLEAFIRAQQMFFGPRERARRDFVNTSTTRIASASTVSLRFS